MQKFSDPRHQVALMPLAHAEPGHALGLGAVLRSKGRCKACDGPVLKLYSPDTGKLLAVLACESCVASDAAADAGDALVAKRGGPSRPPWQPIPVGPARPASYDERPVPVSFPCWELARFIAFVGVA